MSRHLGPLGLVAVLGAVGISVSAQDAEQKVPLTATVVSVTGVAQKRSAADAEEKWEAIKAGDELDEMTIIRTGLGSEVVLKFSDRGDATIRNATKIGIKEFSKQGQHVKAELGLKYGTMRAQVDSTKGTNDFKVVMPVATLSVRGTGGSMGYSGDFGMNMNSTQGPWNVTNGGGGSTNVGAGGQTNGNLTNGGTLNAQNRNTQMGDPNGGTTGNEGNNLMNNGSGLGIVGFAGGGGNTGGLNTSGTPGGSGTSNGTSNGNGNGHNGENGRNGMEYPE